MQTVTSLADSGAGTLRAAIAAASLGDTIVFAITGTINLTSGDLTITQDLTITGPGFSFMTISTTHANRIFTVTGGVVNITGLTLNGGEPLSNFVGGSIKNSGTLTLSSCIIQGGQADQGGGIYNLSTITASNCLIKLNGATLGDPTGQGGGIYNTGTLTMTFCTVDSNTVNASSPVAGGGIWNNGTVTLNYCRVTNNTAIGQAPLGGGIYNEGTVTLNQTTVDGNLAGSSINNGVAVGGGIASQFGTLVVAFSTVSNNTATFNGAGPGTARGGGIYSAQGNSAYVNSSTISTNHCVVTGGSAVGGAMWLDATTPVQVNNSTLVLNSSGCYITSGAVFLPYDSIICGNTTNDIEGNQPGLFAFISQGHCIFGTNTVPYHTATGDFILANFGLLNMGPLQMNGGTTFTHALLSGSPAIDAGSSTVPVGQSPTFPSTAFPTTDQRGGPRIINGIPDIGAFEATPPITYCIAANTLCQNLVNPTPQQIAATKAALNAQALAQAQALAGAPTACCKAPAFATIFQTGTLTNGNKQRFSFTPTVSNQSVSFWVWSPNGDMGLKLYAPDGTTQLYRDSEPEEDQRGLAVGSSTAQSRSVAGISYTFPDTQTYFIDVDCYNQNGTFNLYICPIDITGVVVSSGQHQFMFASTYVASTRKLFTVAFGVTSSTDDAVVTVFDAYTKTVINTVSVSLHGTFTGVAQLVFYNPHDNSVWVLARRPLDGANSFVRLDPTTGAPLESFITSPAANLTITAGVYEPANNTFYAAVAIASSTTFDQINIFDCGARTWLTPVPITGFPPGSPSTVLSYANDSVHRNLYVFASYVSGTKLLTAINTTTNTGSTSAITRDFGLSGSYLPIDSNGKIWGACTTPNPTICTYDPVANTFVDLAWARSLNTLITVVSIAYDPCRNCMVLTAWAEVFFENLSQPFVLWGVGYYARIGLTGGWIESGIVDTRRTGSPPNAPDPPVWAHLVWNPIDSRMNYISTGTIFQE